MPIDITDQPRRVQYAISGTGPYDFDFEVLAESDIAVYRDTALLALTTHYTVALNSDGTGAVTLLAATGTTLTILGARPYRRITDYATGGDFTAIALNAELDSLQIQILQIRESLGRALALSSVGGYAGSIDFPAPGAGELIRWNTGGDALETVSGDDIGDTFLQSSSAAVARSWTGKVGELVSVRDVDAGEGGDDVAAIMSILTYFSVTDKPVCLLWPEPPAGFYSIGSSGLQIANNRAQLWGLGGGVWLKYVGTAAAAAAMLRIDKADHGGDNLSDIEIRNLHFDGNLKALRCLDLNGVTRGCELNRVKLTQAVNLLRAIECYYMGGRAIQLNTTPVGRPGFGTADVMAQATYEAALYGAYFDVCNGMDLGTIDFFNIGSQTADASTPPAYEAAIFILGSRTATLRTAKFEGMHQDGLVYPVRHIKRIVVASSNSELHLPDAYYEYLQATEEINRAYDGGTIKWGGNLHANIIKGPAWFKGEVSSNISYDHISSHTMDVAKSHALASGTAFQSLKHNGGGGFIAGALTTTRYSANGTVNAKQGIACDPIIVDNGGAAFGVGRIKRGGVASITVGDPNDITVPPYEIFLNENSYSFLDSSGTVQLLRPDLTVAATWYLWYGPFGPMIDYDASPMAGRAYMLRAGTFTTPGAGGAPAAFVMLYPTSVKLGGVVNYALAASVNANYAHWASKTAQASAAALSLDTITFAAANNKDDSVIIDYTADLFVTEGADASVATAKWSVHLTWDGAQNGVAGVSTPVVEKAVDATLATFTVTAGGAFASNVYTPTVTGTNGNARAMTVVVGKNVRGIRRAADTLVAWHSGMTKAV